MSNWTTIDFVSDLYFQNAPGVYAIYIDGVLVYIGSTNNIKSRMCQHQICLARYSNSVVTPWGYFTDVKIKIRRSQCFGDWAMIELRLIRKLRPRFNYRGVKRKEVEP